MSSTPIRTSIVAAAALTCMLGLTACHGKSDGSSSGGGGSTSGGSTSSTGSSTASSGGGSSSSGGSSKSGSAAVAVKNFSFNPGTLTIAKGTKVTWTFDDSADHNVSVQSGPQKFTSPNYASGKTYSHTFNTAGTYSYICTIHQYMTAKIVVK